jgi:hypothetical protein
MFTPESEWIGRLEITRFQPEPFTLHGAGRDHTFGFADRPLFYLDQAHSPDDPWDVGICDGGRAIPVEGGLPDAALAGWLPSTHRDAGLALAERLPEGTYLWLRSRLEPSRSETILMGNEWVDAEPNMLELSRGSDYYAAIIGSDKKHPPAIDQPLLGVTILNYDGTETMQAVLFFSCLQGRGGSSKERVLVIPESGPLILDSLATFSAEDSARCLARWTSTEARELTGKLAHVPPAER